MTRTIEIVDRGRGPQLSTSRMTVQDLLPYLQQKFSPQQIMEIMPVLTVGDIQAVEQYIQENYDAVMEQDRRIRERIASRQKAPEVDEAERSERLRRLEAAREVIRRQKLERNGEPVSGAQR